MKTQSTVSFQEYFLKDFLEETLQGTENVNDLGVQKSLQSFIAALKNYQDMIGGIEVLAQYPGTSDLSIFFADVLDVKRLAICFV